MPSATKWTPPGERRRRITIQQEAASSTTALGFLSGGTSWAPVLTTWAKVTARMVTAPVGAVGASEQPILRALSLVNIRYAPGVAILPGMRVVESDPASNGATYLIQNVQDVEERHRELILFCSQVPATTAENQ